jgi:hypothetical protein
MIALLGQWMVKTQALQALRAFCEFKIHDG